MHQAQIAAAVAVSLARLRDEKHPASSISEQMPAESELLRQFNLLHCHVCRSSNGGEALILDYTEVPRYPLQMNWNVRQPPPSNLCHI